MSTITKKLKADIEMQKTIQKTRDKTVSNVRHTFIINPESNLISLTPFQRLQLVKALETYFPNLYVDVEFTRKYVIECETELERLLKVLDDEMSQTTHFNIYKDCKTPEYDFLRQLRLRYMTK